jgi:hypothetical protein
VGLNTALWSQFSARALPTPRRAWKDGPPGVAGPDLTCVPFTDSFLVGLDVAPEAEVIKALKEETSAGQRRGECSPIHQRGRRAAYVAAEQTDAVLVYHRAIKTDGCELHQHERRVAPPTILKLATRTLLSTWPDAAPPDPVQEIRPNEEVIVEVPS